jgi:small subunit ribosomal protein S8
MENSVIDLIIRIKNGYMARLEFVNSPHSVFKESIVKKLVELKFVKDYQVEGDNIKTINIELFYEDGAPSLTDVKIISKPGQRFYVPYSELKSVLGGLGHSIISTSKGVMTDREARKAKIGGELLFQIW